MVPIQNQPIFQSYQTTLVALLEEYHCENFQMQGQLAGQVSTLFGCRDFTETYYQALTSGPRHFRLVASEARKKYSRFRVSIGVLDTCGGSGAR